MIKPWLKLFRVVNLPTVPGDVLVGASIVMAFSGMSISFGNLAAASAASVLVYLYGLLDNDILGSSSDPGEIRPLASGEISLTSARIAKSLVLCGILAVGVFVDLPREWFVAVFVILVSAVLYNRTKSAFFMGLCRAFNVFAGIASQWTVAPLGNKAFAISAVAALLVWFGYIYFVTRYSKGEEFNESKRVRVGKLVGAVVYVQLAALIACAVANPECNSLLIAGLAMLFLLRILRRMAPYVSAS